MNNHFNSFQFAAVLSSLGPHRHDASSCIIRLAAQMPTLAVVSTLSEGYSTVRYLPALPRRLTE